MKSALAITLLFVACLTGAWSWFHVGVKPPERYLVLHAKSEIPGYEFIPEPISEKAIEILATTNLINGTFTKISPPSPKATAGKPTRHAEAPSEGGSPNSALPPSPKATAGKPNSELRTAISDTSVLPSPLSPPGSPTRRAEAPSEGGLATPQLRSEGGFRVFMATWKASDSRQLDVVGHTPDICWAGAGWVAPPVAAVWASRSRSTLRFRRQSLSFSLGQVRQPYP